MNLYDFFKHPDLELPSEWNSSKDFEAYVSNRFDKFLTLIGKLDSNAVSDEVQRRKSAIETCCKELLQSLRLSFEGHPHEAYTHFGTAMSEILPEIKTLALELDGPQDLGILYRVRQTLSPSLQAVDLFPSTRGASGCFFVRMFWRVARRNAALAEWSPARQRLDPPAGPRVPFLSRCCAGFPFLNAFPFLLFPRGVLRQVRRVRLFDRCRRVGTCLARGPCTNSYPDS